MILNNYNTILYITEHRNEPLSEEQLLKIHSLMTEKALDNPDDAGRFRQNDDIVVGNAITGETVHTPPSHTEIPQFVDDLCDFFNDDNKQSFIHPILRESSSISCWLMCIPSPMAMDGQHGPCFTGTC